MTVGDGTVQGRVGTEEELLAGLAAGIEGTGNLRAAERTVVEQSAIVAGEGNALGHALVDDVVAHFGQTVHVGLAAAVVTALDGVVEQTVDGVVVVLVVLGGVDTTLRGDGVGAARGVADAEHFDVVPQLTQRGGCGSATETGADHDDLHFTLIGRTHDFDVGFVLRPFQFERSFRNLRNQFSHIELI